MFLIVLLPAILAFQVSAGTCKEFQIVNQLKGSASQLCRMVYAFNQQLGQCQFMHCLNPCTLEPTTYSSNLKQCQIQCPKVGCSLRLLHGSEQNENEGDEGGESGGDKLKTILAIVLSIAGASILLVICCCLYKRCNRAVNIDEVRPVNETINAFDEKHIEMVGPQQTEIMRNCTSKNPTDNRNNCAIDLLNKANVKLSCEHFFHPKCIMDWKAKKDCCPLCRKEINNEFVVYCCVCFVSNLKLKDLSKKKYVCEGCSSKPIEEPDAISEAQ